MEQPALIQRPSPLKWIVCLLGIICTVALCFPSASKLIYYYRAASTVKTFPFQYPSYNYDKMFSSPDLSRLLAFDSQSKKGIIWDYASQRIIQQVALNYTYYPDLAWSPDQRYLLYNRTLPNYKTELDLWDFANQKKVFSVTGDYNLSFQDALWSPDNTRIALHSNNKPPTIINAATGQILAYPQSIIDNAMNPTTITWSPDSKLLVLANYSAKDTGSEHFIYSVWVSIMDVSTRRIVSNQLRPITTTDQTNQSNYMRLSWSPDGKAIVAAFGQQLWLLNPYNGTQARRISSEYTSRISAPLIAWSPDSTRFAIFGDISNEITDYELAIWRITDLQKVQVVEQGELSKAISLYWPPQSQHLLLITDSGNQETLPLSLW